MVYVSDPVFSAESGFYDEPFTLKISAPDGWKIYYTVDCSIPDENSILYEDGIEITCREQLQITSRKRREEVPDLIQNGLF